MKRMFGDRKTSQKSVRWSTDVTSTHVTSRSLSSPGPAVHHPAYRVPEVCIWFINMTRRVSASLSLYSPSWLCIVEHDSPTKRSFENVRASAIVLSFLRRFNFISVSPLVTCRQSLVLHFFFPNLHALCSIVSVLELIRARLSSHITNRHGTWSSASTANCPRGKWLKESRESFGKLILHTTAMLANDVEEIITDGSTRIWSRIQRSSCWVMGSREHFRFVCLSEGTICMLH